MNLSLFISAFLKFVVYTLTSEQSKKEYILVSHNLNMFVKLAFPRSVLIKRERTKATRLLFIGTIRGTQVVGIFSAPLFKYINEYTGISLM